MLKYTNKVWSVLLLAMLTLNIAVSTFGSVVTVYANEVDTEEETEETEGGTISYDSVTNNVTEISDSGLKNALIESSKYDISMQYIMTYNILKSKYLGEKGSSEYGRMYSNDNSESAFQGAGSKTPRVKVGAMQAANNAIADGNNNQPNTTVEDTGGEGSSNAEKKEEAADKLANMFADVYLGTFNTYFAMPEGSWSWTTDGYTSAYLGYNINPPIRTQYANAMNKRDVSGSVKVASTLAETEMRTAIYDVLYEQLSGMKDSAFVVTNLSFNRDFVDKVFKRFYTLLQENHSLQITKDELGTSVRTDGMLAATYKHGDKVYGRNASKESGFDKGLALLANTYSKSGFLDDPNVYGYSSGEYFTKATSHHKTKLDELNKSKARIDNVNLIRSLIDESNAAVTLPSGYRTMAWTPLIPVYSPDFSTMSGTYTKYANSLKDYDGSTVFTGTDKSVLHDSSNKPRALQVADIFYDNTDNTSPVLTGQGYEDMFKYGKMSISGDTSNNGTSVGDDTLGNFINYMGVEIRNGPLFSRKVYPMTNKNIAKQSAPQAIMGAIASSKDFNLSNEKTTVGIDNYGNIIWAENGEVIVPYWQNTMFLTGITEDNGKKAYLAHPIFSDSSVPAKDELISIFNDGEFSSMEAKVTAEQIIASGLATSEETTLINSVKGEMGTANYATYVDFFSGTSSTNKEDKLRVLAMIITTGTNKQVAAFNLKFMEVAPDKEMYVGLSSGGYLGSDGATDTIQARWTAASIIQKIGMIFDYGLGEILRLTFSSVLVNIYNSNIATTGLSGVFYTPDITSASEWQEMIVPLGLLLLAFTPVYILFMLFQVNRGVKTAKDIILQFIMLALIFLIPVVGYGAVTDLVLNKPAQMVLDNQLKQTIVMDFYLDKNKERAGNFGKSYEQLFGTNIQDVTRTSDNYILTFYTTTHKKGFDITLEAERMDFLDSVQSEYMTRGHDWSKHELVSVKVSLFDLYVWATETNLEADNSSKVDLFTWLEKKDPINYKDVGRYDEYWMDTSIKFDMHESAKNILPSQMNGKSITASQLFLDLHKNSLANTPKTEHLFSSGNPEHAMRDGLNDTSQLMSFFRLTRQARYVDSSGAKYYQPTTRDFESVLRDLSMINSTRAVAYGSSSGRGGFSPITTSMFNDSQRGQYNFSTDISLNRPKDDFFGVYETVKGLFPYQDTLSWDAGLKSLERMTYDINYDSLLSLANVYSLIPESTKINETNVSMTDAIHLSLVTEVYFQMNESLGFKNFPTSYSPATISFDNYLKMVYIPFADYGIDQANFGNSEVMRNNVAAYLALREPTLNLVVVLVAAACLAVYGLFMLALFYFLMMIITVYSFVSNYVLRGDYSNKSWFGSLVIYTALGLVKLGLVTVWYAMTTILNTQYISQGGASYPFVMIHSLAIIGYLALAYKFVIVKVFQTVVSNPGDLGGEEFTRQLSEMGGNVKAKLSLSGSVKAMGNVAGNAAKRTKDMARGAGRFSKGAARGALAGAAGIYAGTRFGLSKANKFRKAVGDKESAKSIADKLTDAKVAYSETKVGKATGAVGRFGKETAFAVRHPFKAYKNAMKNTYVNDAERKYNNSIVDGLSAIPKTIHGVSTAVISGTDAVGKVYATKNAATATVLTLGSVVAAKAVADGLVNAGKVAKSQGNKVFVESTLEDITTQEGRATLLDEGMANLVANENTYRYTAEETPIRGDNAVYFSKEPQGQFKLLFNNKHGLSRDFYDRMRNDKQFNKVFTVSPGNEPVRDLDGKIKDNTQVTLSLKNRNVSDDKVQRLFESYYHQDSKYRKENDITARSGNSPYNFVNLTSVPRAERELLMKEAPNSLLLQEHGFMYLRGNKEHLNFVNTLQTGIAENSKEMTVAMHQDKNSLMSFINKGEGHGLISETVTPDENPTVFHALGKQVKDKATTFYTGDTKTTEKIAGVVNAIQGVTKLDETETKTYFKNQSSVHAIGKQALLSEGSEKASTTFINKLSTRNEVKNTEGYLEILESKRIVDSDVRAGYLNEQEAEVEYNKIFDKAYTLSLDTGTSEEILASEARKINSNIVSEYFQSKDVISKKMNVGYEDIDQLRWDKDSLSKYKETFGSIQDFKVDNSVGLLVSDNEYTQSDVTELVSLATGKKHDRKAYSTGYVSRAKAGKKTKKPNQTVTDTEYATRSERKKSEKKTLKERTEETKGKLFDDFNLID